MERRLLISLASILALPAAAWGQELHEVSSPYPYPGAAWSPYLAGGLIGVLTMLTLTFSKKPVGAYDAYADLAGLLGVRGGARAHCVVEATSRAQAGVELGRCCSSSARSEGRSWRHGPVANSTELICRTWWIGALGRTVTCSGR